MLGVDPQMTQMDADVKLAVIRVFVRDMFLMVLFNDYLKCRSERRSSKGLNCGSSKVLRLKDWIQ